MYGWEPQIGDPTIYGWFTVAAYAVTTLLCWQAATHGEPRNRTFWIVLTAITAILCVNKQLDFQTFLTGFARAQFKEHGWYERRQEFQLVFVMALGAASILATILILLFMRRAGAPVRGAIAGLALLLLFIFLRAVSFEKMDWLITRRVGDFSVNRIAEIGGATIISISAWSATSKKRQRS